VFLGLDFGTSSVKGLLIDENQSVIGSASAALTVDRPHLSWSEQAPDDWWTASLDVLDDLAAYHPSQMAAVKAIGLSGQMHGATLLGADDRPLRPCILWNDTRSAAQCGELEAREPQFLTLGGNRVMPGFTAPKLQWVRENEPGIFEQISKVLLPKDYIRLKLTGDHVSDMSDSAGTLWLDVAKREWSAPLLAATGLDRNQMPRLVEGSEASGEVRTDLCQRYGWAKPPIIAGGAGDNAASACGIGALPSGAGFVSLGTSGVVFVATERFQPNTKSAVHAFCHAVPNTWHQMGVILSAADSLNWLAHLLGAEPAEMVKALDAIKSPSQVAFLPYLGGERTPHNDANIRGSFAGLSHATGQNDLTQAVLEGVAYALRDCLDALTSAGSTVDGLTAVGGGSRSDVWLQALATILKVPIFRPSEGDFGASLGAARLAMAAESGSTNGIFSAPPTSRIFEPEVTQVAAYDEAYHRWRALYPALKQVGY